MNIYYNELKRFADNPIFIETGTYRGRGVIRAIRAGFKKIYSIEVNMARALRAKERLSKFADIDIIYGDSRDVLPELLDGIDERITFWLDAHGPGYCSLLDELKIIGEHKRNDHTLLIDDVRLFGVEWPHVTDERVIESVLEVNPEYSVFYIDGVVPDDILVAACAS